MAYLSGEAELEAAKRQVAIAQAKVRAKAEAERLAQERKAAGGVADAGPNKALIAAGVVGVAALAAYLFLKK